MAQDSSAARQLVDKLLSVLSGSFLQHPVDSTHYARLSGILRQVTAVPLSGMAERLCFRSSLTCRLQRTWREEQVMVRREALSQSSSGGAFCMPLTPGR